ncbi:MAG: 7-carboxy-7-deazaguanine synthase QueE [Elusimicrobiota bacterium]|jgi:organic radical activating enzyme|nr:7-carboxy-7-deazaguanine synthase QueE [Elusimicrobiota bacterium]
MPRPSSKLNVNEIFYSIQGEGKHAGLPAVFVRLAGCGMGCAWCDTKYAQKITARLTPAAILARAGKYPAKAVIITGGEPAEQDILPLIKLFAARGWQVHLETNGARDIDTSLIYCTTASPKKNASAALLDKADVIKLVVERKTTKKEILKYKKYAPKACVYLQPEGSKQENINKCLKLIKQNPWLKLSLQLHKILKIK